MNEKHKQPNYKNENLGFDDDMHDTQIAGEVADKTLGADQAVNETLGLDSSTPEQRAADREGRLALLIHQAIKDGQVFRDEDQVGVYRIPNAKRAEKPDPSGDFSINYSDQHIHGI